MTYQTISANERQKTPARHIHKSAERMASGHPVHPAGNSLSAHELRRLVAAMVD